MKFLYKQDVLVSNFVCSLIEGCERGIGNCKSIGVTDGDELIAGVLYHNWNPEAGVIEMSCAASNPRWLQRNVLHRIFEYPFDEIGCQMVVMRVSHRNKHMKRIFRALDFNEYLIPRLRGRDEDEIIFTLTVEAWKTNKKFTRCVNGKI